jgi:putative pyruvate formate lyase activating enzyme
MIRSIRIGARSGIEIPLVYNRVDMYAVETLRLLDGVIDIYMPDAKYGEDAPALALSHAPQYVRIMKAAIREMHRQVGDLIIEDDVAIRGLILRHLVLPDDRAGNDGVLNWIAEEISRDTYVNIMPQYRPAWHTAGVGGIFPDRVPPSPCRTV